MVRYNQIRHIVKSNVDMGTPHRDFRGYRQDKGEWSPEGDYLPEGDQLRMFKPEVRTAEWSVT